MTGLRAAREISRRTPAVRTPGGADQRKEEVVKLIAEGHPSKEIATALVISHKTVERHRANVLARLGMRDRTELTRDAIGPA